MQVTIEPFSSSVLKGFAWVFANNTKICTKASVRELLTPSPTSVGAFRLPTLQWGTRLRTAVAGHMEEHYRGRAEAASIFETTAFVR